MRTVWQDDTFRIWDSKHRERFSFTKKWGFSLYLEFPSDWHEGQCATLHMCLVWGSIYFSFPWFKRYEDHYQCSGPMFGFSFFEDLLFIYYGNSTGSPKDKTSTAIYMPWHWVHRRHTILSEKETHEYTYKLKSGEIQNRLATINAEEREWRRWWLPSKLIKKFIDISFNDEVGERTGSWKGGTIGCGYEMKQGETPLQTLRRMEVERKF